MPAIDDLIDEHRCIEKILILLENTAISLENGNLIEEDKVKHLFELITDLVEKIHHGKEENVLFPLMAKYGFKKTDPPVKTLLEDHDNGRTLVKKMKAALKNYGQNQDSIIDNAPEYVKLIRLHIKKEDALFKVWDKKISSADQDALLKKCRELEETVVRQGRRAECISEVETL